MAGAYEMPGFQMRLQARINEKAQGLTERLLSRICEVDGVPFEYGTCPVCGRRSPQGPTDEEIDSLDDDDLPDPSPDAVKAAARKAFEERLERQRAEREGKPKPDNTTARPKRDWSRVIDPRTGTVRHW